MSYDAIRIGRHSLHRHCYSRSPSFVHEYQRSTLAGSPVITDHLPNISLPIPCMRDWHGILTPTHWVCIWMIDRYRTVLVE